MLGLRWGCCLHFFVSLQRRLGIVALSSAATVIAVSCSSRFNVICSKIVATSFTAVVTRGDDSDCACQSHQEIELSLHPPGGGSNQSCMCHVVLDCLSGWLGCWKGGKSLWWWEVSGLLVLRLAGWTLPILSLWFYPSASYSFIALCMIEGRAGARAFGSFLMSLHDFWWIRCECYATMTGFQRRGVVTKWCWHQWSLFCKRLCFADDPTLITKIYTTWQDRNALLSCVNNYCQ